MTHASEVPYAHVCSARSFSELHQLEKWGCLRDASLSCFHWLRSTLLPFVLPGYQSERSDYRGSYLPTDHHATTSPSYIVLVVSLHWMRGLWRAGKRTPAQRPPVATLMTSSGSGSCLFRDQLHPCRRPHQSWMPLDRRVRLALCTCRRPRSSFTFAVYDRRSR